MNPLHYAVQNQSEELIKILIKADLESSILRNERNLRNQKPEHMDTEKKFDHIFYNIFELISLKNNNKALEKLNIILNERIDEAHEITPIGKNTVFHFAVVHNNYKGLRLLARYTDSSYLTKENKDGLTPWDLALYHVN